MVPQAAPAFRYYPWPVPDSLHILRLSAYSAGENISREYAERRRAAKHKEFLRYTRPAHRSGRVRATKNPRL
jgi:hypothetical protein